MPLLLFSDQLSEKGIIFHCTPDIITLLGCKTVAFRNTGLSGLSGLEVCDKMTLHHIEASAWNLKLPQNILTRRFIIPLNCSHPFIPLLSFILSPVFTFFFTSTPPPPCFLPLNMQTPVHYCFIIRITATCTCQRLRFLYVVHSELESRNPYSLLPCPSYTPSVSPMHSSFHAVEVQACAQNTKRLFKDACRIKLLWSISFWACWFCLSICLLLNTCMGVITMAVD